MAKKTKTGETRIELNAGGAKVFGDGPKVPIPPKAGKPENKRTMEIHVPLADLDQALKQIIARYGARPERVDIQINRRHFWKSDDVEMKVTEYLDLEDLFE